MLTANKKYYGGAPKIGTLQFRVIPDESSILSGMKAGAFQLGLISDPRWPPSRASDKFTLVKQPALSYHALMLNGRNGPLKNVRVRQAIACAVDRNQVMQTAAYGDGTVTGPITSPASSTPRPTACRARRATRPRRSRCCRGRIREAASRSTRSSRPVNTRRPSPRARTCSRSCRRSG